MSSHTIHSYKDLIVWQRAIELVIAIYKLTDLFPKDEQYVLTSQMRRAAISIPSNIAEGRRRGSKPDYLRFLRIAYASGAELETQIEIARHLPMTKGHDYTSVNAPLEEVMKMLNVLIHKLNPNHKPTT